MELIEINGVRGYKTLPNWLKKAYIKAVKNICQGCHKHGTIFNKLEIHRKVRGCKGGLYTIVRLDHIDNNVQVLHKKCHQMLHANENSNCKSK